MALSDEELRVLRLFVNQCHNEVTWALRESWIDYKWGDILVEMDTEFEDNLLWLANGRTPWTDDHCWEVNRATN